MGVWSKRRRRFLSSGDLDIAVQEASQGGRKVGGTGTCHRHKAQDSGDLIPPRAGQTQDKAQHYWETDSRGS